MVSRGRGGGRRPAFPSGADYPSKRGGSPIIPCVRIAHLQASDYRNIERLDIELGEGTTVFVGDNAQGKSNLQSMIFEPANKVVWLSTGQHAASGTFHRIDLAPYFADHN